MILHRFFFPLLAAVAGLVLAPLPAHAENPLEKLHKKLFGDDDRKKDRDKDKDRKKHDDDHRHHHHDDRRSYDHRRYDNRRSEPAPVIIERRTYVEPSRPYYERRYEPAPRSYYAPRSLEADVQLALRQRGYYRGPIDGDLGPGSRNAIREYQYARRLPVTGRVDSSLLRSLGL